MESLQNASWPRHAPLSPPIKALLTKFYHCVDSPHDPHSNTTLAESVFAPDDATFIINNRVMHGRNEILHWRSGAASGGGGSSSGGGDDSLGIKTSLHAVEHVYNLDGQGTEILSTGVLYLEMKDGKKAESRFAARGKVVQVDGEPRFAEWQGWVDYLPYVQAGLLGSTS